MLKRRPVAAVAAYGAWLIGFGLWQFIPYGWDALWGGRPFLFVPLIVSGAMFTGPLGGGWIGLTAGVLWDVYSTSPFGTHALLLMAVGCLVGVAEREWLRNNAVVALLLCAVTVMLELGLYALISSIVWRHALLNVIHTLLWTAPIYIAVRATAVRLAKRQ